MGQQTQSSRPPSGRKALVRPSTAPARGATMRSKSPPQGQRPRTAALGQRERWSYARPWKREPLKPGAPAVTDEPVSARFLGCTEYPAMTLYLEPNAHHHKVIFSGKTDRWKLVSACK